MAWQPTSRERDLELIVFGAMLVSKETAIRTLEGIGNHGFYNSDVGMLVDRISAAVKSGQPLKEDVEFVGWCKRNDIELNGGSVISSIAHTVKGNGRRRAAERALRMAGYAKNMGMKEWAEQLQQTLQELTD